MCDVNDGTTYACPRFRAPRHLHRLSIEYDYLVGPMFSLRFVLLTLLQLLPHVFASCVRDGRILHLCGTASLQDTPEALSLPFRKPHCRQGCLWLEDIVHV